jgi:hypothetical protein
MRLRPEVGLIRYTCTGRISVLGLTQFEIRCAGVWACLEVMSGIYGIRSSLMLTADDNLASWRSASDGMALSVAAIYRRVPNSAEWLRIEICPRQRFFSTDGITVKRLDGLSWNMTLENFTTAGENQFSYWLDIFNDDFTWRLACVFALD